MSPDIFPQEAGRLDSLLAQADLSRSQAARLIKQGQVRVNGAVILKPSHVVSPGDAIIFDVPEPADAGIVAQDVPFDIIYQDQDLAVVNKPAGIVVHPAAGHSGGTLVNGLMKRLDSLSGVGGALRPGIIHRLDKDTSGLLIVAKNDTAHLALSRALADRRMHKVYLAWVAGRVKADTGRLDGPIGRSPKDRKLMAVVPTGREALTDYQVLERRVDRTLVALTLITGRTHQIRVHMKQLGHPVLGDPLYGHRNMPKAPRLMLHAYQLSFLHPVTKSRLSFYAQPDPCFDISDGVLESVTE